MADYTPETGYAEALKRIAACRKQGQVVLDLEGLSLTTVPPEIGLLANLAILKLGKNQLATLPSEICQLTGLVELILSGNNLATLPPEIGQLTKLVTLSLSKNQLATLPPEIGQLTDLANLSLGKNQLATLPPEIGQLTELRHLTLNRNCLTMLPSEIRQLTALSQLQLQRNQLTMLPPEIGELTALRSFSVSSNRLTTLPREIGHLTALWTLWLENNQLTTLPPEIGQLTALKYLYLHDNPGLGLPVEVLGPAWKATLSVSNMPKPPREILAAYFRIMGEAGEPLSECKLIVVGRGQAGKTSLIKRLSGQPYDPHEAETHGITIQKLEFNGERGDVTARVWDFGGQVVLHSMHEFFLTARSLYLLVLGERDDMLERDAAYWLQLIRSYAGDAPVVVALNKSAGRQRHFDKETLERTYGPILGWVATECSEPDAGQGGITELRQTLTAALDSDHMDDVRRKFPKKWHAIKADLETMTESFLDYNVYAERCRKLGEADAKEQTALAGDLHDLGVALNYARDPRLRDTTVLRPDWLANGIYAVLRANDLDDKLPTALNVALAPDGIITAESLARIHQKAEAWKMLKAEDYPADKRDFLLRLMDLFHLSYPLDDAGQKQIVPTLLPLNPPPGTDEPEDADRVRLRYEFQVVPAPLIPWFIARTFSLIPQRMHWRRGAILVYGNARARVWTTQDERYVFVTVAGEPGDRDELVTMIRGTMHDLFAGYRGLQVTEQHEYENEWVPRATLEKFGRLEPDSSPQLDDERNDIGDRGEAEP
jgi:internalin A